jgi:hypothetical protein
MQEAYARHDPNRRVLIRYEEMRRDPAGALSQICPVVGLGDPPRERITEVAGRRSFESVPRGEKGSGRQIRRARPGSWRDTMRPEEIAAMHEILAGKLEELGYLERGDVRRAPIPLVRLRRRRRRPAA